MNEIIRDAETIAQEINTIKQEVRDTAIRGAIEIGRRLQEAKSMVPYGSWGRWLQENVDYSERTAQDLMRIATEYGRRETQALAEIRNTTQAVLLLALDMEDRERFVQEHDMAAISTRELEQELQRIREENDKKQLTIEELMGQVEKLKQQETAQDTLDTLNRRTQELEKQLEKARDDTERMRSRVHKAEEKARFADQVKEKAIKDGDAIREKLEADLQEARENVKTVEVVPEAVEQELKRLRDQAQRTACECGLRAAYDAYKTGFENLMDRLDAAQQEDAEMADRYRSVFYRATLTMAERMRLQ